MAAAMAASEADIARRLGSAQVDRVRSGVASANKRPFYGRSKETEAELDSLASSQKKRS
jgi:hypothetical protein